MAKLTRVTQQQFASTAGSNQIGVFGSFAAGNAQTTTSPVTAQSLSNWLDGWYSAVSGDNSPCIEDMNAVQFVYAYQLAYLMQEGVAEWDSGTTYFTGSIVNDGNGNLYVSLQNNNLNNALTNGSYWTNYLAITTLGDLLYGGTGGAPTRLAGNTSTTKQYLTQTGTGSISAPPVWSTPQAPTIQTFLTTGTTTGFLFTISTSTTCAVGDTYTNNGNTYTVLSALSAQSGQVLFTSGTGGPNASGTLTRTSGSGTSSITFSAEVPLGTYTPPSGVVYFKATVLGGGGGGGASGGAAANGVNGLSSFFGSNIITVTGGSGGGGGANTYAGGGASGTASVATTSTILQLYAVSGGSGTGVGGVDNCAGGPGGSSILGGGGGGASTSNNSTTSSGYSGATNTGAGGGGAAGASGGTGAAGGGASGAAQVLFTGVSVVAYPYVVGTGGAGGTGSQGAGGAGADGQIMIEEFYS